MSQLPRSRIYDVVEKPKRLNELANKVVDIGVAKKCVVDVTIAGLLL